jgi:hypothetical protein
MLHSVRSEMVRYAAASRGVSNRRFWLSFAMLIDLLLTLFSECAARSTCRLPAHVAGGVSIFPGEVVVILVHFPAKLLVLTAEVYILLADS